MEILILAMFLVGLIAALYDMYLCKRDGAGCVILEWR